MTKNDLLAAGIARATEWCELNDVSMPPVEPHEPSEWRFDVCAYYRPTTIHICLARCAAPGLAGRNWSWPGYAVDRTPYGVVAHELGHHVDHQRSERRGSYFGDFSVKLRRDSGEPPLTGYAPNDVEWFAEMFRLFVTNPILLLNIRPRTYNLMLDAGIKQMLTGDWRETLDAHGAPERILAAAANRVKREAKALTQGSLL